MDDIKIPMKIFQTYEELTEYYKDGVEMELGLYESEGKLLVGHAPTAYSFNPQYFTGNNELMPDYVPESPIDYTITATSNNTTYGYVTGGGTYPQHSEITLNAYAYNGYKFDKWSNGVETSAYTFAVEEDANLVGNFVDNTYTVTIHEPASELITTTGAGVYIAGTSVTVTATPAEGYYFAGWLDLDTTYFTTDTTYTFIIDRNTNFQASVAQYYTVSATPNNVDYGSTTGSGNQYKMNDSVTVTATANTGYRFVNWTEDNVEVSTSSSYTFTMNINDVTLVANFEPATANISISASPAGYGSVDAAGSTVIGESYTVMAEANTGYVFVNWTEDGTEVSTSANYTFTVTGDRTLVANFDIDPLKEPFYVENITNENETLSIAKVVGGYGDSPQDAPTLTIEYSSDKTNWSTLGTTSTTALTRTIAPGEKLYLRCKTNNWSDGTPNMYTNKIDGTSKIGGNIMSLLYGSSFNGQTTVKNRNQYRVFGAIFENNTNLISAEKLIITDALQFSCMSMFKGCTSLTTSPELLCATLETFCYDNLFAMCSSLNYIKCLATTFANQSTQNWLQGVSANGTFVNAAGATWPTDTGKGIPSGWTVVEV